MDNENENEILAENENENLDITNNPFEEEEDKKVEKEIEVITGDGDNLDISPVYSYVKIDKPDVNRDKNRKIIIPTVDKDITEENDENITEEVIDNNNEGTDSNTQEPDSVPQDSDNNSVNSIGFSKSGIILFASTAENHTLSFWNIFGKGLPFYRYEYGRKETGLLKCSINADKTKIAFINGDDIVIIK